MSRDEYKRTAAARADFWRLWRDYAGGITHPVMRADFRRSIAHYAVVVPNNTWSASVLKAGAL